VRHRLGLATRTQISVYKSLFPTAGTAVSLFRAGTVQQRPLLPREVETIRISRYEYRKITEHILTLGVKNSKLLVYLLVNAAEFSPEIVINAAKLYPNAPFLS